MNKDIIFRQDAIDALNNAVCDECIMLCNEPYSKKCCNIDYYSRGVRIIEKVPSAQLERKKGRWIDEGQYAEGHSHHAYCCSECEGQIIEYEPYPFCPWCGADMNKRNKRNKEENKWVSEIHGRLMDETGGKAVYKTEHWGKGQ